VNSTRKKARQARRRDKRTVAQNDLVLRGWVPMKHIAHTPLARMVTTDYGLMHLGDDRFVVRQPNTDERRAYGDPRYAYRCRNIGTQRGMLVECAWNDLQAQWLWALRGALLNQGWL
jgi:hypothetical protein